MIWNVVAGLLLLVHSFVHLRVWVLGGVGRSPDAATRSWLGEVPRGASSMLAGIAAALFALAGAGALAGQDWTPVVAIGAGAVSVALIALVFNRWLSLGLVLDALVIALALRALTV